MITELMIVLIVVGSIMVFVVWNNSRQRRQRAEEQRVVIESTAKLKEELERTASEVIQRMETQASNLENLLEDADRNRTEFEGRLAELKKVIKRGEGQATEIKNLLQKLSDAGENVEDLQRKLDAIELKISTRLAMPMQVPVQMPIMQPVPSPISPPPMLRQTTFPQPAAVPAPEPVAPEPIVEPPVEEPSNEARDFEAVLRRSMAESQDAALAKRAAKPIPDRPSIVLPSTDKTSNVVAGKPVKIETRSAQQSTERTPAARQTSRASTAAPQRQQTPRGAAPTPAKPAPRAAAQQSAPAQRPAPQPQRQAAPQRTAIAPQAAAALNAPNSVKIKNMLLEGKTVEDIARELGMGRGAVELVQEMTRRMLDRRKAP